MVDAHHKRIAYTDSCLFRVSIWLQSELTDDLATKNLRSRLSNIGQNNYNYH